MRAITIIAMTVLLAGDGTPVEHEEVTMSQPAAAQQLMKPLLGRWTGTARTWFEPGKLADTSEWQGEIRSVAGGHLLLEYDGAVQGKPFTGTMLLAVNPKTGACTAAWVDSFHSSTEMLVSRGMFSNGVVNVLGSYKVEGHPEWGWRTELQPRGADEMTLTMWNVMPEGQELKAVEVEWRRVK